MILHSDDNDIDNCIVTVPLRLLLLPLMQLLDLVPAPLQVISFT